MTAAEPVAEPAAPVALAIPAALPLPEARETARRLLEAVEAARADGRALAVEIEGEHAQPAALQLLVATVRSAAEAGLALHLGPQAAAARAALTPPAPGAAQ